MPIDPRARSSVRCRVELAVAVLLCLLLQLAAARSAVIAKDGIGFIRIARRLAVDPVGAMTLEDQHPGYPALVLAGRQLQHWLGNHDDFAAWISAARLASGLCGAASIVLVWLLARRLYNERVAGVAALLAALWPLLRQNGADVLSDTPHLMFYLAAAWAASEGLVSGRTRWFAAAGIASGLAYWIRPEGLVVALVSAAVLVGLHVFRCKDGRQEQRPSPPGVSPLPPFTGCLGQSDKRAPVFVRPGSHTAFCLLPSALCLHRGLLHLAALCLATLAVAVPYMAIAGKLTSKKNPFRPDAPPAATAAGQPSGALVVTPVPISVAGGKKESRAVVPGPHFLGSQPFSGLVTEPAPGQTMPGEIPRPDSWWQVPLAALAELLKELAQGFRYLLLALPAVGHWAPGRVRRQTLPAVLVWALLAFHSLLLGGLYCLAGYISHRHVIPLVALMIPTAAAGVVYLEDKLSMLAASARWRPAVSWGMAAGIVAGLAPIAARPLHAIYHPLIEAALWVKADAAPGDSVLTTSDYARFYGGMDGLLVAVETPSFETGLVQAPRGGAWPYLVLEVDQRTFDAGRMTSGRSPYEQVGSFGGTARKPWAKVLVFRARGHGQVLAGGQNGQVLAGGQKGRHRPGPGGQERSRPHERLQSGRTLIR